MLWVAMPTRRCTGQVLCAAKHELRGLPRAIVRSNLKTRLLRWGFLSLLAAVLRAGFLVRKCPATLGIPRSNGWNRQMTSATDHNESDETHAAAH